MSPTVQTKNASKSSPDLPPHTRQLPPLLRRCWYGLNQAFRRRILHLGLTPTQFTILRWLNEAGDAGLNQKDLAEKMASDPNTIASLVCRMKEAGQLGCCTDPNDGRAKRVRILAKGKRHFQKAKPFAIDLQNDILKAIPAKDRQKFLQQLETLANACQCEIDQD